MPTEILMPALSPTMEEGKLAKWHVKEGDKVSSGDVIAEIETDKATMEVEAVDEGVVSKLLVEEGTEGVKVNAPIALLLGEGFVLPVPADDELLVLGGGGDGEQDEGEHGREQAGHAGGSERGGSQCSRRAKWAGATGRAGSPDAVTF